MVIGEFNGLKGSWTETGLNLKLKHTCQRIDETENPCHTNRLVSKPHSRTVYRTMLYICMYKSYIFKL